MILTNLLLLNLTSVVNTIKGTFRRVAVKMIGLDWLVPVEFGDNILSKGEKPLSVQLQ